MLPFLFSGFASFSQPGSPIACNWYMNIQADASGATLGDVDITGDKLTIEAIFNRTADFSAATAGGDLVSKHCNTTDANYFLRPQMGGITTTNGYFQIDLPCDLETNTTYHVAMVYDGAQLYIYRNGFLEDFIPATGNLITNDWETTIGTEACSSNWGLPIHFRGYITEARIWKRARTTKQIQEYKNQTIPHPINDPDLLCYYTFHSSGNQGTFPHGADVFGNASVGQTNPNCTQDNVGCFVFAGISNDITKQARKGTMASSIRKSTASLTGNAAASSVNNATVAAAGTNVVVYPNPARKSATLIYSGDVAGLITINVIDVTGKRAMVVKRPVMKGRNAINVDLNNLSNGVYSVQLFDGNKMLTKKLVISK